jgi:6-phosphofructokinase 2
MIYTITLDPALERTLDVEEFIYDDVNHIIGEERQAGGKGVDVSRVVKELGGYSVALGFVGGYNGREVEGRAINEGLVCDFTSTSGETRTNIVINQRKKTMQTLLSAAMSPVNPIEVNAFYSRIKNIPPESYVVMVGPIPEGLNQTFWAQLITVLKDKRIKVVLDADNEALKRGLDAGPFLIKPNMHELSRLVDKTVREIEEIIKQAEPLLEKVEYIVISMGARGAVGMSKNERIHVAPPKVNVKSSLGAGDALIGGLVFALNEGADFRDALKLGVSCGTASTLNPGYASCLREDIYEIQEQILMKNI